MFQLYALIPLILISSIIFEPSYSIPSCQCVVFRMDDVQDYWVNNAQIAVIHVFHKTHTNLTIGIIGNIIGNDSKLIQYVKNNIKTNESTIEIANHGWNHENFADFNKKQQSILMEKTDKKLTKLFDVKSTIFIPPFDSLNNYTISAMKENGLKFISSDVDQDNPLLVIKNNDVYHVPGNAETSDLINNDTNWHHHDHRHIFMKIISSIQKYGYSVVVIHPQEYSVNHYSNYSNQVDEKQIRNLELLIDDVKHSGIKITSLNHIPFNMDEKTNPYWLNNIFSWHEQGKISDNQLFSCINYLLDKKIISF